MYENHANEQYFFDAPTLDRLREVVVRFEDPCVLCAPMLGRSLQEHGQAATVLGIDRRFADLPGYRRWDLCRPEPVGRAFGLILCDPPFFNVSLSQLFRAIRTLARFDLATPIAIGYLARRQSALLGTFAPFNLRPSTFRLGYQTVQDQTGRNDIRLYTNFGLDPGPNQSHERHHSDRRVLRRRRRTDRPVFAGARGVDRARCRDHECARRA